MVRFVGCPRFSRRLGQVLHIAADPAVKQRREHKDQNDEERHGEENHHEKCGDEERDCQPACTLAALSGADHEAGSSAIDVPAEKFRHHVTADDLDRAQPDKQRSMRSAEIVQSTGNGGAQVSGSFQFLLTEFGRWKDPPQAITFAV